MSTKKFKMDFPSVFLLIKIIAIIIGLVQVQSKEVNIPDRFDAREQWPYCDSIRTIFDQKNCDLSWNFAVASAMSDRACIATKGSFNRLLSVQDLIECFEPLYDNYPKKILEINVCAEQLPNEYAGTLLLHLFFFLGKEGIVTADCKPLEQEIYLLRRDCRSRCTNTNYKTAYEKDTLFSSKTLTGMLDFDEDPDRVKAEIMHNGPVTALMYDYKKYENAAPGTYIEYQPDTVPDGPNTTKKRAVKLIGWDLKKVVLNDSTTDTLYGWIIANSHGNQWCDKGFCFAEHGVVPLEDLYIGVPEFLQETKTNKPADDDDLKKQIDDIFKDLPNASKTIMSSIKVLQIFVISSMFIHTLNV